MSGHIHLFEFLAFAQGRPPQLMSGQGGGDLNAWDAPTVGQVELGDMPVARSLAARSFGFLTMEQSASGWIATDHGVDGATTYVCQIGSNTTCVPPDSAQLPTSGAEAQQTMRWPPRAGSSSPSQWRYSWGQ